MRISRRELQARTERQATQIGRLITERDTALDGEYASASQLARVAAELSALKDEVAAHIFACGHPDTALSDAHSAAIALREHLEARGINLRVELARLEGSDL